MAARPSWTNAIYFLQSAKIFEHNTWGVNIFVVASLQSKGGVSKIYNFYNVKIIFRRQQKNSTAQLQHATMNKNDCTAKNQIQ